MDYTRGLAAASPWLVLGPIIRYDWSVGQAAAWTGAMSAGLLVLMIVNAAAARRERQTLPGALETAVACAAAGAAIAASGSLSIGGLGLSLAAGVIGVGVGAALARRGGDTAGPATLIALVYGCVLIVGYHYTFDAYHDREGLGRVPALLLAAALLVGPTLSLIGVPAPGRFGKPGWRAVGRIMAVVAPAAAAVALGLT